MVLSINDLTSNVVTSVDGKYTVTGDGVFDRLMETVNTHLDAQFKLNRITGTEYATVYLGALQSAIQQAVAYTTGQERTNAEVALLGQKEITEYAQTQQTTKVTPTEDSILGRQSTLYDMQAQGFKWNADQKYLKTIMDAWSINVSTAGVPATEVDAINAAGVDNVNDQIQNAKPVIT